MAKFILCERTYNMLNVTDEWLESWGKVKSLLRPYGDTASYFAKPEIAGYQMDIIELGLINVY